MSTTTSETQNAETETQPRDSRQFLPMITHSPWHSLQTQCYQTPPSPNISVEGYPVQSTGRFTSTMNLTSHFNTNAGINNKHKQIPPNQPSHKPQRIYPPSPNPTSPVLRSTKNLPNRTYTIREQETTRCCFSCTMFFLGQVMLPY